MNIYYKQKNLRKFGAANHEEGLFWETLLSTSLQSLCLYDFKWKKYKT